MQTSAEFDVWWNKNGVKTEVAALGESYKEIAWKAWEEAHMQGFDDGYTEAQRESQDF